MILEMFLVRDDEHAAEDLNRENRSKERKEQELACI